MVVVVVVLVVGLVVVVALVMMVVGKGVHAMGDKMHGDASPCSRPWQSTPSPGGRLRTCDTCLPHHHSR